MTTPARTFTSMQKLQRRYGSHQTRVTQRQMVGWFLKVARRSTTLTLKMKQRMIQRKRCASNAKQMRQIDFATSVKITTATNVSWRNTPLASARNTRLTKLVQSGVLSVRLSGLPRLIGVMILTVTIVSRSFIPRETKPRRSTNL